MIRPNYKKPFSIDDFRGYFFWTSSLTEKLGGHLYHACHEDELKKIIRRNVLYLRSKWTLILPTHGECSVPGTWTGLNYYNNGNNYGPFLIKLPLSVLNGKNFMVFKRKGSDRNRYFFVQYESKIPIYSFDGKVWRIVKPDKYFNKENDGETLSLRRGAIYDIVITKRIYFKDAEISGVNHPNCIPQKCEGMRSFESRKIVEKLAEEFFEKNLKETTFYKEFVKLFPNLIGKQVTLPDIETD